MSQPSWHGSKQIIVYLSFFSFSNTIFLTNYHSYVFQNFVISSQWGPLGGFHKLCQPYIYCMWWSWINLALSQSFGIRGTKLAFLKCEYVIYGIFGPAYCVELDSCCRFQNLNNSCTENSGQLPRSSCSIEWDDRFQNFSLDYILQRRCWPNVLRTQFGWKRVKGIVITFKYRSWTGKLHKN